MGLFSYLSAMPYLRRHRSPESSLSTTDCLMYACAGGVFSASLYYSYPILLVLSQDLGVSQATVINLPTLAQAGDAMGLILILPLADLFPRRPFVLILLLFSVVFWVGLCFVQSFAVFSALTFLSALFSGVIQVFLVLAAELSTPDRQAVNLAIVASGPTIGILMARILAGVLAQYAHWRYVYIMALCAGVSVIIMLFLLMPAYPSPTPISFRELSRKYPSHIAAIFIQYTRHPILVQASLLSFCTFFAVTSFWTTLTYLLSFDPYNYSTSTIGLFGLVGASTLFLGPVYARYIIRPIGVPLLSAGLGVGFSLTGVIIGLAIGQTSVAGPTIQALLLDAGLMILQISNRISISDLEPLRRNQINTAFVVMLYAGMVSGTKAGNDVFEKFSGWRASEGLSVAVLCLSLILIACRGPYATGWLGGPGAWKKSPREQSISLA